jgi:hypothetical protein
MQIYGVLNCLNILFYNYSIDNMYIHGEKEGSVLAGCALTGRALTGRALTGRALTEYNRFIALDLCMPIFW